MNVGKPKLPGQPVSPTQPKKPASPMMAMQMAKALRAKGSAVPYANPIRKGFK